MPARNGVNWTPQLDDELRKLCMTTMLTFAEILTVMNTAFPDAGFPSRDSLIGRAYRLGIIGNGACKRARKRKIKLPKKILAPQSQPIGFADVRRNHCRWPLTEVKPIEDFLFCGAPIAHKATSYCLYHYRKSRRKTQVSEDVTSP